jgi:hypothetical protein
VNDDFVYMYVGEAMQANAGESLAGTLLSQQINPLKRVRRCLSARRQASDARIRALYRNLVTARPALAASVRRSG